MQLPSINFLSIPVAAVTMQQTVQLVDNCIRNNGHIQHAVINAGKVVAMQKDRKLYDSVVNCDLINADGQTIVWAARLLGKHLPERVAGIDLMENLVALAHQEGYKCFFFGAKEEVVRRVTAIYADLPGNGFFLIRRIVAVTIPCNNLRTVFSGVNSGYHRRIPV